MPQVRRSRPLVAALSLALAAVVLFLGLAMRDSALNATVTLEDLEAGVRAQVPSGWLIDRRGGDYVFRAIDPDALPSVERVDCMSGAEYAATLCHDPSEPAYNPHFRQLLHVAYKVAAEMGDRFLDALRNHRDVIGQDVTDNLYERHIRPLFLDES